MSKLNRDESLDSLKVFLIWLVVLGHLLSADMGGVGSALHTYIFLFHMPAFSLLSGYFTNTKDAEKLFSGTLKILETFVVWHIIGYLIIGIHFWGLDLSISTFVIPIWHYWYLLSLVLWRLMAFCIDRYTQLSHHPKYVVVGSTALALFVGFLPFIGDPFSLSRTFVFGPFFLMGYYLRGSITMQKIRNTKYNVYAYICLLIFVGIVSMLPRWGRAIYGDDPYAVAYSDSVVGFYMRCAYLMSATALTFSIINIWLSKGIKIFARYGRFTLSVLILHSWFIIFAPKNLFIALPLSFLILVVCLYISQMPVAKIILNPITYIVQYIRMMRVNWGG